LAALGLPDLTLPFEHPPTAARPRKNLLAEPAQEVAGERDVAFAVR